MTTVRKCSRVPQIILASVLFLIASVLLVPTLLVLIVSLAITVPPNSLAGILARYGGNPEGHIVIGLFLLGLVLAGSAVFLLLRPRRMRVPLSAPATATDAAENGQNTANSTVVKPCKTGDLPCSAVIPNESKNLQATESKPVRIYHTRVMAAAFIEDGDRQAALAGCRVGDILALQTKATMAGGSVVLFRTVTGTTLGLMDASLVRTIRETYPGHRIGAVVERVEGGRGRPYVGHIAVTVYQTPMPTAPAPGKRRRARKGT